MIYVLVGCVVAVFGLGPAALGKLVEHFQDKGKRCKFRRPHPAVIVALDLLDFARSGRALLPPAPAPATWDRIRAGMRPAPRYVDTSRTLAQIHAAEDGPIVTDAEVDEEFERMPLDPGTHPYPLRPTVLERPDGHILIDEGNRIHVRPGRQPWDTCSMPVIPAPEPTGPARAWDQGDGIELAPPVMGFARSLVYGEAPVLAVDKAERLAQEMIA